MSQADDLHRAGRVVLNALDLAFEHAEMLRLSLEGCMREINTLQVLHEAVITAGRAAIYFEPSDLHEPAYADAAAAEANHKRSMEATNG